LARGVSPVDPGLSQVELGVNFKCYFGGSALCGKPKYLKRTKVEASFKIFFQLILCDIDFVNENMKKMKWETS
jgi:hypothetical protein